MLLGGTKALENLKFKERNRNVEKSLEGDES